MNMPENEVLRQLSARKSVRAFAPELITPEEREAILTAAAQAPTAGNQQFYTILDITDQALKERMADLCDHQPFIAQAPLVLVFLADSRRWAQVYRAAGEDPRPAGPGDALLAIADACIAAQNAVTAAWSLGIGSCYIGDVLENCEQMREALHLPTDVLPAAMLVFGRPTQQQAERRKPARFALDYVVQQNTYRDQTPQVHREAVEARAAADGKSNFDFDHWTKAFGARKYESAFSREMSRSAAVYLADYKVPETK